MTIPVFDPHGETDYKDWEEPESHLFHTQCNGCPTCVGWSPGLTFDQIRAQRVNLVEGRRLRDSPEPTAREIAREDRDYWDSRYDD